MADDTDSSSNSNSPLYGYVPTRYVCYIFSILYLITTVLHFGQALRYRAWWLLPTAVLAGAGEVLGWGGRLWSTHDLQNQTPYTIQIVSTIIAPTPLAGAIFIAFGRFSACMGQQYSRLSSRLYSKIFLTIDIFSLFVQAGGGSVSDGSAAKIGANIMLAGIILQLVSLTVFSILAGEYLFRYITGRPARRPTESVMETSPFDRPQLDKPSKHFFIGLFFTTLFLYIRAIYRTIELSDGFDGRIIHTEVYFNVLDGAMVVLAMYTMNLFHPARLLKKTMETREWVRSVPMLPKRPDSV